MGVPIIVLLVLVVLVLVVVALVSVVDTSDCPVGVGGVVESVFHAVAGYIVD